MDFEPNRKVESADKKIFELTPQQMKRSDFLEALSKDFPEEEDILPVPEVTAKYMELVVKFLEHYSGGENPKVIPKPLPHGDLSKILDEWDYNYISNISLEESIELVNAANYLGIADLVHLCSARIASEMLIGTIEEVREKFGIKCDMTEEEKKELDKYPID